jgi:uncharacterized protein (DUF362 family)
MSKKISRRSFLRRSAGVGAATFLGATLMPRSVLSFNPGKADISVVNGTNYYEGTIKAIDALGGIRKFVKKGYSVGLLVNSAFDQKGAYVQPDIPLAVIRMCKEANAGRIICLQQIADEYWDRKYTDLDFSADLEMLEQVKTNVFPAEFNEEEWQVIKEPKGAELLKDTQVIKAISNLDVFINIPIAKHHGTTLYTGALKNMMGLCTRKSNVNMHLGSGERNDPVYLGQSIAEICLIRKPDLIVVDATEFITSNGPSGPGEMKKMDKVVAGTDIVAVDALCCSFVNFSSDEIVSISKAHEMGIGNKNYFQLNISEVNI